MRMRNRTRDPVIYFTLDPGSGMGKFGSGSRDEHPGSATLTLKVVSSEKVGWSGVTSALGTWYGGVVMGVLLSFDEAAILYRNFNSAPS
jgi:hypothetical protein